MINKDVEVGLYRIVSHGPESRDSGQKPISICRQEECSNRNVDHVCGCLLLGVMLLDGPHLEPGEIGGHRSKRDPTPGFLPCLDALTLDAGKESGGFTRLGTSSYPKFVRPSG